MHIVAGKFRRRALAAPTGDITRPTSERLREALFNICQSYIEGAEFLDLFAGSGAMGLEALSRGAKSATFVDHNRESIRAIHQNIESFAVKEQTYVAQINVLDFINRQNKRGSKFQIIYADPPYNDSVILPVLQAIDEGQILTGEGMLFIEVEKHSKEVEEHVFTSLQLISSRRLGRSSLLQFKASP